MMRLGPVAAELSFRVVDQTSETAQFQAVGRHFDDGQPLHAITTFHHYGYRPSAGRTIAEQARLAHLRDLYTSARPLYEAARSELRAVEMLPEARAVQLALAALDEGAPPPRPAAPPRPLPTMMASRCFNLKSATSLGTTSNSRRASRIRSLSARDKARFQDKRRFRSAERGFTRCISLRALWKAP